MTNTTDHSRLPIDIPYWAMETGDPASLGQMKVAPSLRPEDLDEEDSTHTLGTGLVAHARWPWDPQADDLFAQVIGEPWRAPGVRMTGWFKTTDAHTRGPLGNAGVFLFVNPTDVVFGTTPCPIWIVVLAEYDKDSHRSWAFADPQTAEARHSQLIGIVEAGCGEC